MLSGRAVVEESRKRGPQLDMSSSVTDTASPLNNGPRRSSDATQSHNSNKRQHLSDAQVSRKTSRKDNSRLLTAAVSSSTRHSDNAGTESNCFTAAVPTSTHHSDDAGTVADAESVCLTAAVPTSTHHSDDAGTVGDAESVCLTAAVPTSIHHSDDAGTVADIESSFVTAAVPSSTRHSDDAAAVADIESVCLTAVVSSSTHHSDDAGSVADAESICVTAAVPSHGDDAGSVVYTATSNYAAAELSSSQSTKSKRHHEITATLGSVERAATRIQSIADDENRMHSSSRNSEFG